MYSNYSNGSNASINSIGSRLSEFRSPKMRTNALRTVLTRAESLTEETADETTINVLEECMKKADSITSETDIEEKLNNQEEILLDSKMMNVSSHILQKCTRTLTKGISSYSHIEFAQKLSEYVCQLPDTAADTPDWSLLESQITKCFTVTPQYSTLLGTLTPLERKEVVRKKAVREAQAPVTRPENVIVTNREAKTLEQTVLVKEAITKYMKTSGKPLHFFFLVLHPTDFGKTIENILHVSFIARDGNIVISEDENGNLLLQPKAKDLPNQIKARGKTNIQNIVNLKMHQWKTLVKAYNIKKPMLNFGES